MRLSEQELKEHWWESKGILEEYNGCFIEFIPNEEENFCWNLEYLHLPHSKFRVSGAVFGNFTPIISLAKELIDYLLLNFDNIDRKDTFLVQRKRNEKEFRAFDIPKFGYDHCSVKNFNDLEWYQLFREIEKCQLFYYTNNELNEEGICDINIEVSYNLLFLFDTPPEAKKLGWHDAELLPEYDNGFNTIIDALEWAYKDDCLTYNSDRTTK